MVPVTPVEGLDGDYIFHDGPIITELRRTKVAPTYGSGIQVLNPARVAELTSGRGDFGHIWSELIDQRQMYVSRVQPEKWYSVDTLDHLERCVERMGSPAA